MNNLKYVHCGSIAFMLFFCFVVIINQSSFYTCSNKGNKKVEHYHIFTDNNFLFVCFCFVIVYAPDMPNRLPVKDFVGGLVTNILRALKYWLHYTLVALAWLGVVPITACKSMQFHFLYSKSLSEYKM